METRALKAIFALTLVACGNGTSHGTSGSGGAGGAGGSTTSSTSSSGPCVEKWVCTPWERAERAEATDGGAPDGGSDAGGSDAGASDAGAPSPNAGIRTCVDVNACGTEDEKPYETANLPTLDIEYFKCAVEPILDKKCSMLACHGTEEGRAFRVYARGRKRLAGQMLSNPPCGGAAVTPSDGCDGSNQCLCAAPHTDAEWQKNYDAARGFGLDTVGKPYPANKVEKSDLLAQPVVDGKPHGGIHLFKKTDADYATIKNWLGGAALGSTCKTGIN